MILHSPEELKKHFHQVPISFKPDSRAMEVLASLPQRLDDREAQAKWGWSVQYRLKEMVEDFIREFRPNPSS